MEEKTEGGKMSFRNVNLGSLRNVHKEVVRNIWITAGKDVWKRVWTKKGNKLIAKHKQWYLVA